MTSFVVLVQRCIVLVAVVLCYFQVRGDENVNCELYPYHHTCRGTMSRKRAMFPITYGSECEGNEGTVNCIRELEERRRTYPYVTLSKSKLLTALLDNDLQKDIARSARHKSRNDEFDERKALMENFLSELESSDSY